MSDEEHAFRRSALEVHGVLYRLAVVHADGTQKTIDVPRRPLTVGRTEGVDIPVGEARVSRHHCVIFGSPGRLVVRDLGSSNGTFVNGAPVAQATLGHGDVIEVGGTSITVQVVGVREPRDPGQLLAGPPTLVTTLRPRLGVAWPPSDGRVAAKLVALIEALTDPDAAARASLALALESLPLEHAALLVAGREGEVPAILASSSREGAAAARFAPIAEVVERVLRERVPYFGVESGQRTTPSGGADLDLGLMRAVFCARLELDGGVSGVLYAETRRGKTDVDAQMVPVFVAVAEQAGRALSVARVAAAARGERARLESLVRTLEAELGRRTSEVKSLQLELAMRAAEIDDMRDGHRDLAQGLAAETSRLAASAEAKLGRLQYEQDGRSGGLVEAVAADLRAFRVLSECMAAGVEIEDGELRLSITALPMDELVQHALSRREADARACGVSVAVGPFPGAVTAMVDAIVIGRVLDVVLGTAIRLAGAGGNVAVTTGEAGGRVELLIRESGASGDVAGRRQCLEAWEAADAGSPFLLGVSDRVCRRAAEVQGAHLHLRGDGSSLEWRVSIPARGIGDIDDSTRGG